MKLYSKIKKKKIKKQATRKYVVRNVTPEFEDKFAQGQISYTRIYNVVLKDLYRNYGAKRLNRFMPMLGMKSSGKKNVGFYVFVGNIADVVAKVLSLIDKVLTYLLNQLSVFLMNTVKNKERYNTGQIKIKKDI